jgi:hypothetical protein
MGQIHNRIRRKSTEPLQNSEIVLIETDPEFMEEDTVVEVDNLPLKCKAHNKEGACICMTPGC